MKGLWTAATLGGIMLAACNIKSAFKPAETPIPKEAVGSLVETVKQEWEGGPRMNQLAFSVVARTTPFSVTYPSYPRPAID